MNKYINTYQLFLETLNDALFEADAGVAGEAVEGVVGGILLEYKSKIPNTIPNTEQLKDVFLQMNKQTQRCGGEGKPGALIQKGDSNHWEVPDVLIAAFSAADAIAGYLKGEKIDEVWRTGRTWPKELHDLGLDNVGGIKDYNSADIIIKHADSKYTGVSLKAKPRPTAADPTIINKSMTAILDKDVTNELKEVFFNFCQTTCNDLISDLNNSESYGNKITKYGEMFGKKLKPVIVPEEIAKKYGMKKTENVRTVDLARVVIGSGLKNKSNAFYTGVRKALKAEVTPTFAEVIYDSIFKPKLQDIKLENAEFNLILVTGMQKADAKTKLDPDGAKIVSGEVKEYKTIFNILSTLAEKSAMIDVVFNEPDLPEGEDDTSAGMKCQLVLNKTPLADLELRFKGNYAVLSDLQFQAKINNDFAEKIHNTKI